MPKIIEKIPTVKEEIKYRYFCHGCTKTAFVSTEAKEEISITCPHCQTTQTTKKENYILI